MMYSTQTRSNNHFISANTEKPPWLTKACVRRVREVDHHHDVSSGIITDTIHDKRHRVWTKQALITLVESMEAYIVEVILNLTFRSRNWFLVGFQHVGYYRKAGRSGTAWTVWHAPCHEYSQHGQRRVFPHHNRGNTPSHQQTLRLSLIREDVGWCVSRAWIG